VEWHVAIAPKLGCVARRCRVRKPSGINFKAELRRFAKTEKPELSIWPVLFPDTAIADRTILGPKIAAVAARSTVD
jgi:hypothetical protein